MDFGFSKIDKNSKVYKSFTKIDIASKVYLIIIFIVFCISIFVWVMENKPESVMKKSLNNSIKYSFIATIEASTTYGNNEISYFKKHQSYAPGKTPVISKNEEDNSIFNAEEALQIITPYYNLREQRSEDMLGNPTRHLRGQFKSSGNDSSTVYIFDYWINTRTILPVRLDINKILRNAGVDSLGDQLSKITSVTIWYHNWVKK